MDCSIPGFPVLQYLLEFAQTHVPWVGDAIQPSHPLSPTSLPALSLSQHQGLFQWVSSLHQVAKVLDLSRECVFLDSLSCHNKDLEWRTLKPPRRVTALRSWIDHVIALRSWMEHVIALRQISVTAQCYSSILAGKSTFEEWGHIDPKTRGEERPGAGERQWASFGSSIYMFLSPCACPV